MILDRHTLKNPTFDADCVDAELTPPPPRPLGRPPKPGPSKDKERTFQALEEYHRARFLGLGLTADQLQEGIDYCKRGYTVEAAAKLVLAGGMRRGLFS